MSRESEKVLKKMEKFLAENTDADMSEADLEKAVQEFFGQYNNTVMSKTMDKMVQTADDYLELAENAQTEAEALKYAKKAVEMEPDNIDALVLIAEITTQNPIEMLKQYEQLIDRSSMIMEEKGYMDEDSIGSFWQLLETRPYIRLKNRYMQLLIDCGMLKKAIDEGKEIIRFNENDNLGIRYTLMHLFAFLEDESGSLSIYAKYDEYEETQMLLPLSLLYFKLKDFDKSKDYLYRLAKANKDTKKFVKGILDDSLDKYMSQMNDFGYRPFSIEELIVEVFENRYLFESVPAYFDWAHEMLKSKK